MLGGKGLERQTGPHRFQAVISPPTERPWASGSFSAVWGGPGSRAGCWQAWSCVYTVSARMGGMVTSALNVPALYGQRLLVYSQSHQIIGARVCLFPSSNVCPFQLSSADRPPQPSRRHSDSQPHSQTPAELGGATCVSRKDRSLYGKLTYVCLWGTCPLAPSDAAGGLARAGGPTVTDEVGLHRVAPSWPCMFPDVFCPWTRQVWGSEMEGGCRHVGHTGRTEEGSVGIPGWALGSDSARGLPTKPQASPVRLVAGAALAKPW